MKCLKMIWRAPATTEEVIRKLERRLGFVLPADYRTFLLRYNGGGLDESNYCFKSGRANAEIYLVTSIFPVEDERSDILSQWELFRGRVPSNLLPIGSDDFGNLFCLGIVGPERDRIFFWDHEAERAAFELVGEPVPGDERTPARSNDYWENVSLVANSFADFINGLGEYPAEPGSETSPEA